MPWLALEGPYATHMLFFGSSRWSGDPSSYFGLIDVCSSLTRSCLFFSRRRQLAQLGSATGVYKTLVKYLVGVPQVSVLFLAMWLPHRHIYLLVDSFTCRCCWILFVK